MSEWTFVTNHGLILAAIAKSPRTTAREIGDVVGITERAAHKIIKDLEIAGYVTKTKVGRKNHYRIHPAVPLKDEATDAAVGELLVMLGWRWRRRAVSDVSPEASQVIGAGVP
ncbi:MAG: winged helix-turn-helix domain-containing protein [Chloroflexi bacterium]|nr:winged helix-turn-helix domain-containing protein [Chloroflexota bacterium]